VPILPLTSTKPTYNRIKYFWSPS